MGNDSIDQKIDLVAQQYADLLSVNHQVSEGIESIHEILSELDLRSIAVEDHIGSTLVASIDEIREELRRLSSRLDAMEGRVAVAIDDGQDGGFPQRR